MEQGCSQMQVTVEPYRHDPAAFTVEAIGSDGEIYQALFAGPDAEQRAYRYARQEYGFSPEPPHQRSSRTSEAGDGSSRYANPHRAQ